MFDDLDFATDDVDRLLSYIERIDTVMDGTSEALVDSARADFALDLDVISKIVDDQWDRDR